MSTDHTAESQLLSVMLKGASETFAVVSSGITPEHFTKPEHKAIYSAIVSAASIGAVDMGTVWQHLQTLNGKSPVSLGDLVAIDATEPTSLNRAFAVENVLALHRTRRLITSLTSALASAKADASNWLERWDAVSPHLQAAQSVTASVKARSLAQIVDSAVQEIENPEQKRTIATGFNRWDLAAGPFRAGELITIAARPGCGKTALGVQIADFATKTGLGIVFFSLEMSGEELVNRIALRRAGVSALMNPREKIKHLEDLAKVKTFHIFDNAERQTLSSIEARSRLIAGSPNGLGLIVVDYLQLVTPSETRAPREQQVAEMSRRFKELAGALKVPVVILAQLNRESEKEERIPRLSDLRESGAIEQDSDRVWFLYQDPKNTPKMEQQPDNIVVSLIQAKCRGGKPWLITDMEFRRPVFQFVPVQR